MLPIISPSQTVQTASKATGPYRGPGKKKKKKEESYRMELIGISRVFPWLRFISRCCSKLRELIRMLCFKGYPLCITFYLDYLTPTHYFLYCLYLCMPWPWKNVFPVCSDAEPGLPNNWSLISQMGENFSLRSSKLAIKATIIINIIDNIF